MKKLKPFNRRPKSWCCMHCSLYCEGWQRWQILVLVALALLSLASLAWGDQVSGWAGDPRSLDNVAIIDKITSTPVPVGLGETPTPYPPEILNNHDQTNGVVFLGGLIVFIIVVGTIGVNRSRRME